MQFDERLRDTFRAGVAAGIFTADNIPLLAANTTVVLPQRYLKRWKFQLMGT